MIKAKDLKFVRTEDPPQSLPCNLCGRQPKPGELSWRMADIPIHQGKDQASIVSKNCQRQLVNHPGANEYVNDLVERCEQMSPPGITDAQLT